jgi:hypothetical protein
MTVSINGTSGLVFNDASTQNTAAKVGMVNRIINGDMRIDQRNAGASVNLANSPYPVDRFQVSVTTALFSGTGTMGQSTVAPVGFSNSLLWTQTTGVTPSAAQLATFTQGVEGNNIADLGFGTADAKQVTLSFWVRSSVTGTYCVGLRNTDLDRSYIAEYSVSAANTWEYKTITISGDTSGTWATDNQRGVAVTFDLGSGSDSSTTAGSWAAGNFRNTANQVSFVGNSGATFYITGVQLEKGSTATSFDYRPYGTELALCQRYFYMVADGATKSLGLGTMYTSTYLMGAVFFPVTMRATPSLSATTGTNYYEFLRDGTSDSFNSLTIGSRTSTTVGEFLNSTEMSGSVGHSGWIRTDSAAVKVSFSSEL